MTANVLSSVAFDALRSVFLCHCDIHRTDLFYLQLSVFVVFDEMFGCLLMAELCICNVCLAALATRVTPVLRIDSHLDWNFIVTKSEIYLAKQCRAVCEYLPLPNWEGLAPGGVIGSVLS